MTNVTITYQATDSQHTLTAALIDAQGNPVTGGTWNYVFTLSDGSLLTPNGPLANSSGTLPVTPTGNAGSLTVSVSAVKQGGGATISGTNTIVIQGAPTGIVITSN